MINLLTVLLPILKVPMNNLGIVWFDSFCLFLMKFIKDQRLSIYQSQAKSTSHYCIVLGGGRPSVPFLPKEGICELVRLLLSAENFSRVIISRANPFPFRKVLVLQ